MNYSELNSKPRSLTCELFDIDASVLARWETDVFAPEGVLDQEGIDRLTYICTYVQRHLRLSPELADPKRSLAVHIAENFGLSADFCQRILGAGQAAMDPKMEVTDVKVSRPNYSAAILNFLLGLFLVGLFVGMGIFWRGVIGGIPTTLMYVFAALTIPISLLGVWAQIGNQFKPKSGKDFLKEHDAFVLYLRSHTDEGRSMGPFSKSLGGDNKSVEIMLGNTCETFSFATLAILNPHDRNDPIADFYWIAVGDDYDWQDAVLFLMAIAKVVIINTGDTGWVKWEKKIAESKINPRKVVLLARDANTYLTDSQSPVLHLDSKRIGEAVDEAANFDFALGMNRVRTSGQRIASMLDMAITRAVLTSLVEFDAQAGSNLGRSDALSTIKNAFFKETLKAQVPEFTAPGEEMISGVRVRQGPIVEAKDLANKLVNEGNAFLSQKELTEAKAKFEAAVQEDPNLGRAHVSLGNIFYIMGELDVRAKLECLTSAK